MKTWIREALRSVQPDAIYESRDIGRKASDDGVVVGRKMPVRRGLMHVGSAPGKNPHMQPYFSSTLLKVGEPVSRILHLPVANSIAHLIHCVAPYRSVLTKSRMTPFHAIWG